MPFKPNYQQARNERSRAKQQKKQEKLRRREEEAAQRRSSDEAAGPAIDADTRPAAGDGDRGHG